MAVPKTLLVLDAVSAAINTHIRLTTLLEQAQIEGRDSISMEELLNLKAETNTLEDEILNSSHTPTE